MTAPKNRETAVDSMIEISALTKHYGATQAVRGISFQVPKGQVVGFLGPNGAGKSTTMKVLTGFLEPTSGSVKVRGIEVKSDPVQARRLIGYLPENNPLYDDLMVEEYLTYVCRMRGIEGADASKAIALAADKCGIKDKRGRDIGELSKGYKQRVGLAQAIVHNPDILVLDEPTTGLDPNQVVEIRNLIRELGQEKTVIMSTHILPEVQHTCSRAIIIADGQLKADGAPATLSADGNTFSVVLVSRDGQANAQAVLSWLKLLPGVIEASITPSNDGPLAMGFTLTTKGNDDPRLPLFDKAIEHKLVLLSLQRHSASLEDTFRRLTLTTPSTPSA
jgi:ABC-2 type transport system ATP-binding protein